MGRIWLPGLITLLSIGRVFLCLVDHELSKVEIVDFETRYYIEEKNVSGSHEFNLMLEVKWNISESGAGVDFDGILYQISDGSSTNSPNFPGFGFGFQSTDCASGNYSIWAVDSNGTSVQCQVPCTGIMPKECDFGGICPKLKEDYQSLPKETRNIILPIQFGREYKIKFLPYRGWRHGGARGGYFKVDPVFCRHELIKRNVSKEKAEAFCKDKQSFEGESFSTGPLADWNIVETRVNVSHNVGEAIIEWQDPHDIHGSTFIIGYAINVRNGLKNIMTIYEKLGDGFNRVIIKPIKFNHRTEVRITPKLNNSKCESCLYGLQTTIVFTVPDFDGCVGNNQTRPYCDPVANCSDSATSETPVASCKCPPGYIGNGINVLYDGGEGCQQWDSCSDKSEVTAVCAGNATCIDLDPPSMEFICSCPDGFKGDGYISGSGCTKSSSLRNRITKGFILPIAIFITILFTI